MCGADHHKHCVKHCTYGAVTSYYYSLMLKKSLKQTVNMPVLFTRFLCHTVKYYELYRMPTLRRRDRGRHLSCSIPDSTRLKSKHMLKIDSFLINMLFFLFACSKNVHAANNARHKDPEQNSRSQTCYRSSGLHP